MDPRRKNILLIDPPTFPRGVLSLSLPTVAACLRAEYEVRILDLNFVAEEDYRTVLERYRKPALCGLKVSAQNLPFARELTVLIRDVHPGVKVIWGGEFPTLMPEECLKSADSVVCGRFEPHAKAVLQGLEKGDLKRVYCSGAPAEFNGTPAPALDLVENPEDYLQFMGSPLESSLGCGEACTFCMVHTMQKRTDYRYPARLADDLRANPRDFVNVIDYNIGSSKKHLLELAGALERTSISGWMGETCIENLDDEEVLEALRRSRCRAIYCGLESLSPASLKTVNKTQNDVSSYKQIIRKAQDHGVEIATGYILGLEGTTRDSFSEFADFCDRIGILYLKLTYLTFNPGAKVHKAMKSKGRYLTEAISDFDGHHLTFLPEGLDGDMIFEGARELIERIYSLGSLWRRSRHLSGSAARRAEFMLFSYCYGQVYRQWLDFGILSPSGGRFDELMRGPMRKDFSLAAAEKALSFLRGAAPTA